MKKREEKYLTYQSEINKIKRKQKENDQKVIESEEVSIQAVVEVSNRLIGKFQENLKTLRISNYSVQHSN